MSQTTETQKEEQPMIKNHHQLYGQDLAGWQLAKAYMLELDHGCMGSYPALINGDEGKAEMFMCLDREILLEVAKFLTPRPCKITEFRVLVGEEGGIAFELSRINEDEYDDDERKETEERIIIINRERFEALVALAASEEEDKSPFKWAPGLAGPGMTQEEFLETLEAAMAKA